MGIKRWDGTQWVSTNTPMTANNITNDSNVSGSKVKDALNTLNNALSGKQKTIYQGNTAPENPVEGDYWDDPNERGIIATIDNTPTSGSQNVVSSGGVFTALSTVASQCINRWDEMWVNGYLNNGNILYHANNIASLNYIDVRDISSLYFRCAVSGTFTVSCYDSSKNFVQGTGTQFGYNVNSNTIFTIPNGISYIRFYIPFASYQNNISINYPSSYTGYYPSKLLKAITNQSAISDAWSAATSYGVGTYCIYDNTLWRCKVQHSNKQPPNTTYWDAVSVCDEIKKLETYSTTETRIGTWIDGKPLYRRSYVIDGVETAVSDRIVNHGIANIKTGWIDACFVNVSDGQTRPINSGKSYIYDYNVTLHFETINWSLYTTYFSVIYTKTTD